MNTAKTFKNGRSQAVRLPKECQIVGEEVYVSKIGDAVILFPKGSGWKLLSESISLFTEDFLNDRQQPKAHQTRKSL